MLRVGGAASVARYTRVDGDLTLEDLTGGALGFLGSASCSGGPRTFWVLGLMRFHARAP